MNKEIYKEEVFNDTVIQTNLPLHYERLVRFVFTTEFRFTFKTNVPGFVFTVIHKCCCSFPYFRGDKHASDESDQCSPNSKSDLVLRLVIGARCLFRFLFKK